MALLYTPQNQILDTKQIIFSRCMQRSSLLCLIFVMLPSAGKFIKNYQNLIIYLYSNLFPCSHSNIWKSLPPNVRSWEKYKNNWDITCLSLVCHTYLLFVLAVGTPPKLSIKWWTHGSKGNAKYEQMWV